MSFVVNALVLAAPYDSVLKLPFMKIIAVEVRTEFSLFSAARVGYRTQDMGRERLRNSAGDGPE